MCVSRSGTFECRCLPGFLGDHCEMEQSQQRQCDPNLCPSYAECIDHRGSPQCICKPEFPGEYPNCKGDSICVNNPCLNGGICSSNQGMINCTCPAGFTGKNMILIL